tara:strand:- start:34 stop:858 length:825 start_codon:yes stop_codon:yes gene_type:complete
MAPVPVPQPVAPTIPMGFEPGGPVDITEAPRLMTPTSVAVSGTAYFTDLFNNFLGRSGEDFTNALGEKFSSKEAAEAAALEKKDSLDAAVATENTDNIVNTVLDQSGLPLNDESKQDFARTVFGMENVNDIDEINRRIADVAIGSTIGKGPDEFAQAVLLGLGEYKKTATARATGTTAAGAEKSRQEFLYNSTFDDTYKSELEMNPQDPSAALEAARKAAVQAAPNAPSAKTGGQPTPSQTPLQQVQDALRLEPNRREEILKQATDMGIDIKGL